MSNYIFLVKQVPDVTQITDDAFDPETGMLIRRFWRLITGHTILDMGLIKIPMMGYIVGMREKEDRHKVSLL